MSLKKSRFWLSREGKRVVVDTGRKNDAYYSGSQGPLYEPVKFKVGVMVAGNKHATVSAFLRESIKHWKAMPLAFHQTEIEEGRAVLQHFGEGFVIELVERVVNLYNDLLMFKATCNGEHVLVEFFTRKQRKTQNVNVHGRVWSIGENGKRNFIILEQ